jgi:hypothetical protein
MNTTYATPVATFVRDTFVPTAEWEKLLMVWTLRSCRPEVDGFTTISWAIQEYASRYHVVERVDGFIPTDHFGQTFDNKEAALDYWSEMVRSATPPLRSACASGSG